VGTVTSQAATLIISAVWPSVTLGPGVLGAKNYEKGAVVELQVTDRYYRAIAKIGFHYFLTQFPAFDGSCFSEIDASFH